MLTERGANVVVVTALRTRRQNPTEDVTPLRAMSGLFE
jgi:hypothetical protein